MDTPGQVWTFFGGSAQVLNEEVVVVGVTKLFSIAMIIKKTVLQSLLYGSFSIITVLKW